MNLTELTPVFVEDMPSEKIHGELYVSQKHQLAIHLCACGCGYETVCPVSLGWDIRIMDDNVTIRPSIGNFAGQTPYHAHYYITNNKIEWL